MTVSLGTKKREIYATNMAINHVYSLDSNLYIHKKISSHCMNSNKSPQAQCEDQQTHAFLCFHCQMWLEHVPL